MKRKSLLKRLLIWRLKNVSNRNFVAFLSIIVGITVGIAAAVIKYAVHFMQFLLQYTFSKEYHNYLYVAYPTIGILLAILFIRYILKQRVGHGIPSVLYAISKNSGIIKRHNMFSSIVTSAFTVGFGGSVGLEGPTVATGASIGSNVGRFLHLNYRQITLLLGCACAGAMAAIFKAPIAAIVFALEVIMLDLTMASLVPLLMASVSAALTSYFILGQNVLYHFDLQEKFIMNDLPFFLLLGVLSGFVSVYFTRSYMFIGGVFDKINNRYRKLITGGLLLGILIFIFPSLYGEGYEAINSCLSGDMDYLFNNSMFYEYKESIIVAMILMLLVVLFKVIAASLTFGSGGVGGIFAPTLFMGANLGLLFATLSNRLSSFFGYGEISVNNFALVGMGGLIAGVLHAPLTAIFLIADITSGYQLFMPLMITATISYATVRFFEPNSVYTIQLAKRRELLTHHKDKAVLTLMKVEKLLETNFTTIQSDATLGDLVKVIAKSQRNIFPVVDEENNFIGMVLLDDIRNIIFSPEQYENTYVHDLMVAPGICVNPDDSMEDVAHRIQQTGRFNIPVVKDGKYLGFVSRANVFSSYRRMLKRFSDE